MRRFFLVLGLLLAISAPAMAQDTPLVEPFIGYSYVRAAGNANINMSGFNGSVAVNLNDWLGLVGDFGGVYESRPGLDASLHSFTFGPRLSYRKEEKTTAFLHALFGATRGNQDFVALIGGTTGDSQTAFTTVVGGGLDVKINDRWAVRAGQLDWIITKFQNDSQSNFRFSAGVVFRIGKK